MINYSIVMRSVNANLKGRNATTANHKTFRAYCDNWLPLSGLLTHPTTIIKNPSRINKHKRGCVISLWRTLFVFSSFSRYGTEKIVFIYNKAQTFTSSGFAFPQKFCIFAENFFKYGKDTNKI